ncbi:MAG: NUDIX hydrolase [Erysipelotrichaceae bacterium]|nr:NUDIX hydrolase [Erysipelotrichaceae bacterium]
MEKGIKRTDIYKGKVIDFKVDDVVLDDGTMSKREFVLHNGGVCIAMKDENGKFLMVKQFRYVQGKEMLEFCAGKIEKDEDPDEAILREAEEELGHRIKNIRKMGVMIPTCAYSSEHIHLYYGEKGEKTGQHFDFDERIDLYAFTFDEIKEMIRNGEIDDGKTIALMYHLEMAGLNV